MTKKGTAFHYRTCNLCEAMCGLEIKTEDGAIRHIKGDVNDPFSQGYICPKGNALQDLLNDPDRLRKPIKKTNAGWKEISWKEAYDLAAKGLKQVQREHGRDAVGVYQGNPNVHNLGSMLFGGMFVRALKTRNRFSATSVDQLPHHVAAQFMMGHLFMLPIPDLNRTDFLLILGANPLASNGSIMSTGGAAPRLKAIQERGGKIVVIDPRKTETAKKADFNLHIRPGTDVFLLASMIYLLLKNEWTRTLPEYMKHAEGLMDLFSGFDPQVTAKITGISARDLLQLTRSFAEARRAVCYGRMGISTQQYGVLCQWMVNLINILTGNFDQPGGAMFTHPAFDVVMQSPKGTANKFNRWQSRVRGLPEFGGELPVAALAEDMLEAGEGQIKGMVTVAGNPILSTPNGQQLDKAFANLDFMVAIDIYLNETSRHADVILPPTNGLETPHYDVVFNALAIHNTAKYSEPLVKGVDGSQADWQIFKSLIQRLRKQSLAERAMFPFLTPEAILNQKLKKGPYALTLKKLKEHKHGLDLGPLKPALPQRLFTQDKKLDLAPEPFQQELTEVVAKLQNWQSDSLLLIGRRHLRSNNSWMHNCERLVKGPERCTLMMHPQDAADRDLKDTQQVEVTSRVGKVHLPVEITDEIMQGVVSIPHGWGHDRKGTRWKLAEQHAGASINDLTDDQLIDGFSGNAAFSGVPVEVK